MNTSNHDCECCRCTGIKPSLLFDETETLNRMMNKIEDHSVDLIVRLTEKSYYSDTAIKAIYQNTFYTKQSVCDAFLDHIDLYQGIRNQSQREKFLAARTKLRRALRRGY